jgi:hypothetical protein
LEDTADDLNFDELSVATRSESSLSATARRQRVWRANHAANQRHDIRERHRPTFRHIKVEPAGFFYRHHKPNMEFATPDPTIVEFIADGHPPPLDCDLDNQTMALPCGAAQMKHLTYFDREPRERPSGNTKAYDEAFRLVGKLLKLDEPLDFPHAEDLRNVRFKPNKYPGNEYRALGFKNRAEAQSSALADAELAWAQLLSNEYVPPHTVRLGGRGKLVAMSKDRALREGVVKGRLILMLSQRDLLLLGNVEQRLTEAYKDARYPVSVGLGWYGGNVTRFIERLIPEAKFFCMDAEKFDASLDPWLINDGLHILRQQIKDGFNPRFNAYWDFVAESLIDAPIARDDGWLMTKSVGTTSGHSYNTLLQSICTLLVGYAGLFSLLPVADWSRVWREAELEALGDDNLTGIPEWAAHITGEEYGRAVLEMTGINWLGKKSFATYDLVDDEWPLAQGTEDGWFKGIQYLGKYFRAITLPEALGGGEAVIPYRPLSETVARLYYPERFTLSLHQVYLRALGNLLDNYGNPYAAGWLNDLLDWLELRMDWIPEEWSPDTIHDAARDYTGVEVLVPRPRRWTFHMWLELTLGEPRDDLTRYTVINE